MRALLSSNVLVRDLGSEISCHGNRGYCHMEVLNVCYFNTELSVVRPLHYHVWLDRKSAGDSHESSTIARKTAEGMVKSNKTEIRKHLRLAVQKLDARGLQLASKWACEQLVGIDADHSSLFIKMSSTSSQHSSDDVPSQELDLLLFARCLITNGEYQRCAHLLRNKPKEASVDINVVLNSSSGTTKNSKSLVGSAVKSDLGIFLSVYSLYMAGEKLKEQQQATASGNSGAIFPGMNSSSASEIISKADSDQKSAKGSSTNKRNFSDADDGDNKKNPFLNELFAELEPLYREDRMDGFLLYLFAVIIRDLVKQGQMQGQGGSCGLSLYPKNNNDDSHRRLNEFREDDDGLSAYVIFVESLRAYPWNWSCWLELSELCVTKKIVPPTWQELDPSSRILNYLSSSRQNQQQQNQKNRNLDDTNMNGQESRVMYLCFLAHYYLELQQGEKAMKVLEGVLHIFPNSHIAASQVALSHYCLRDYEKAQSVFEATRETDPHRIEHLDAYSNILYVGEKRAELSFLAHSAVRLAPHTPETCCVVGNYYSLKGKHERAILYFQRALKLNPKCLSAWTLMGHECVELRNTAAAVQCYRKAVDVSSGGDYRAWYGLGQTYEMLHMYQYALYYYKYAAALRPTDGRMWCAVGNCLCRLGTKPEATKAFERAVAAGDREGVATRELARLYRDGGLAGKAAECYYHHLLLTGGEALVTAVQKVVQGVTVGTSLSDEPINLHGKVTYINGSSSHMDDLISGVDEVVDCEKAEALLYLAGFYKQQGRLIQAELLCSRLMDKVGSEGDEARAMMREIRTLSLNPNSDSNLEGLGSMFPNNSTQATPASQKNLSMISNSEVLYHRNDSNNNSKNSSIGDNIYNDDRNIRMTWNDKAGDEEDSLDYDRDRVEGNLSMSISGSEGGGGTDLNDSGFLSP